MLDAVSNLSKKEKEQSLYDFCKKEKKVEYIICSGSYLSLRIILGGGQSLAAYPDRLPTVSISDANVSFLM